MAEKIQITECDCCGCYHPIGFSGDCRDDKNRYNGAENNIEIVDADEKQLKLEIEDLRWKSFCTGKPDMFSGKLREYRIEFGKYGGL